MKNQLAKALNIFNIEDLIIYDIHKNKITDLNKPLSEYQSLQLDFYFRHGREKKDSIKKVTNVENEEKNTNESIKITFVFLNKNIYPMRNVVSLDSTINDIEKMISYNCHTEDKIIIKYKFKDSMKTIESNKTVDEVKYLIKENGHNGKFQYIMYVDIQSEKVKSPENFEEDDIDDQILVEKKIEDKKISRKTKKSVMRNIKKMMILVKQR